MFRRVERADERRRIANKICSDKSSVLKKEPVNAEEEKSSSTRLDFIGRARVEITGKEKDRRC